MADTALKEMHDSLLAEMPEGAEHDPSGCPLCAVGEGTEPPADPDEEVTAVAKTYTEDEVRAAVAEAVSDLRAEVDELRAEKATNEGEQALADLREALEGEKTELQTKLDAATLEAENAKKERDDIVAWLDGEAKSAEEKAAIEARRDERIEKVKEAANFPETYIEENADRIAAMSDEEFDARLSEWAALSGTKSAGDDELPRETALRAAREGRDDTTRKSAGRELRELRQSGVDVRNL